MITINCRIQSDPARYTANLDANRRWSLCGSTILGAHVIEWREVDPDLAIVTVRISNGACSPNGMGFCGRVYYSDLWIEAESGWTIEPDVVRGPVAGTVWHLVASGQHVFHAGRQMIRRFALRRGKWTASQAIAEIDNVGSIRNRDSFGPQQMRLPAIDLARQETLYAGKLKTLRMSLAAGKADSWNDLRTDALGPFQPPGGTTAYEQGGQGIYFASIAQSKSALLFGRAMADLWQERMSTACFNKATGKRITSEDWAASTGVQPFETQAHGDEEAHDQYAANHWPHYPPALDPSRVYGVGGTCPYEGKLAEYDTIDDAHETRAALSAEWAAYGLGDRASIEFLCDLGHHLRMSWCEIGPKPDKYSRSLRAKLEYAAGNPNIGAPTLGRGFGWVCRASANLITLARTPAEKVQGERWADALLKLHALVAMPSGVSQRAVEGTGDAPSIWDSFGMPRTLDATRTFETMIVGKNVLTLMRRRGRFGLLGRVIQVFRRDPNLGAVLRMAANVLDNSSLPPLPYDGLKQMGPPNCIAVAIKGGRPLDFLSIGRGSDPAHVEPFIVELIRTGKLTGEQRARWLSKLTVYGYPAGSLGAKRVWCQMAVNGDLPGVADVQWCVEELALLQEIGA